MARSRERHGVGGAARTGGPHAHGHSSAWRKYGQYVLHALVLVGIGFAGMKYINGDLFWDAVHRFRWTYAPLILGLTLLYVLVKGLRFVRQLRELVPARRSVILRAYVAGQACTLLPAGSTVRAGLLEQVGVPLHDSAASIAVSSLSDQAVLLFCALLSALWFEAARGPAMWILTGLSVLSVLLGLEATRTWLLSVIEAILGKIQLLSLWHRFLESMGEISSFSLWLGSVANAAGAFALMVLALRFAVQGVGADIPFSVLLLAFTLPTFLGRISAMPAGVGVTEAGMIGILDAAPNVTADQAAAATLIFRIGTVVFAAMMGGLVYLFAWRRVARRAQ